MAWGDERKWRLREDRRIAQTHRLYRGERNVQLSLNDLRFQNVARANRLHRGGGIDEWSAAEWAVALAGEVGEVCNDVKKLVRHDGGLEVASQRQTRDQLIDMLSDEMADALIQLDLLAASLGIRLAEATVAKFNLWSEENGYPERLG